MVDLHYITLPEGFLEEETRNGVLVPAKLKEVWAIELDMLKLVQNICEKYDIKYFADGGTLLGAVREKGFIPWDNDIDVLMNMENYNKFIECAQKEIKFPYGIKAKEIDPTYIGSHCVIIREDTGLLHTESKRKFVNPILIDILPWCVIPDNEIQRNNHLKNISFLKKMPGYICGRGYIQSVNKLEDKKFNTILSYSVFGHNFDINRLLEDKRNYIGETLYMPFEFLTVPVPEKYDIILCHKYGVDWKIPKRGLGLHDESDVVYDTDTSYMEYQNELFRHIPGDHTGFNEILNKIRHNIYNTTSSNSLCLNEYRNTNVSFNITNFDEIVKWLRELPEEYAKIILFDYSKDGYSFRIVDFEGNQLYSMTEKMKYVDASFNACKKCIDMLILELKIK